MAIDPGSTRNHGVRPITPSEMAGSRGADGRGVDLPETTFRNPGPTENLRGIEPNTSLNDASVLDEPIIEVNVAGEAPPRGEVFEVPDASGITTFGGGIGSLETGDT